MDRMKRDYSALDQFLMCLHKRLEVFADRKSVV